METELVENVDVDNKENESIIEEYADCSEKDTAAEEKLAEVVAG